jgi:tetratricopeptide (TPR) repeat protein
MANHSGVFENSNSSPLCPLGDKSGEGKSYGNIGNALFFLSRYDEAIEYQKKSLEIMQQTGRKWPIDRSISKILILARYVR